MKRWYFWIRSDNAFGLSPRQRSVNVEAPTWFLARYQAAIELQCEPGQLTWSSGNEA